MVLQDSILSEPMTGGVLVLVQLMSECDAFEVDGAGI